jgi:hypothetical protein
MQTLYPDAHELEFQKPAFRPSELLTSLAETIRSCNKFVAEAENGMIHGNIRSVRQTFTQAEEALERAQYCVAEVGREAVPQPMLDAVSDLGTRLDALWVRLICAFC